jgi:sulfide:quinone oxidoreductase
MRHIRFDNDFALGDAGSSPNSKTGAAIRKQTPVVAANLATSFGNALGSRPGGLVGPRPTRSGRAGSVK